MKKICFAAAVALMGVAAAAAATPKVIAHRGYWTVPGSAQNSIRSLVKADSVGCYGSEFDVWMTSDGVLVVNHDPHINGIVIQNSPAETVLAQKLSNGENVPTLEQYLSAAKNLKTRLILELKTHDSRGRENDALNKTLEAIMRHGLEDRTDFIAFSRDAFPSYAQRSAATSGSYYLNGDFLPSQIKLYGGDGIDYHIGILKAHPEWIDECHKLGLKVNIWTVDDPEDMKWCIEHGADFITTNYPERLQKLLK